MSTMNPATSFLGAIFQEFNLTAQIAEQDKQNYLLIESTKHPEKGWYLNKDGIDLLIQELQLIKEQL